MKLARIDHFRCDDIAASTYVWGPDDLTPERLEADVAKARESFLAAGIAAASHAGPRPESAWSPGLVPTNLEGVPAETTVGELRAARARQKEEWAVWETKRKAASRPFGAFLVDLGYQLFYDVAPDLSTEVGWGHRHGQQLDLDDTAPHGRDLRGMLRHRPRRVRQGNVTTVSRESYVVGDPTDPARPEDD